MYPDNFFMHLNSLKNPQLLIYLNCIASLSKYSPGVVKEKSRKSFNLQITLCKHISCKCFRSHEIGGRVLVTLELRTTPH